MSDRPAALTTRHYGHTYYEEHAKAGLDYLVCGDWQRDYGQWLVNGLAWHGCSILDVGCACGAIAQGILEAGAGHVCGVDLCEPMIQLGRPKFPKLRLEICDAVNLHHFHDGDFAGLHCAQVAEHWRPEHVPMILRELRRVTQPAGRMYLALDTVEYFDRHGGPAANQDPTHICVRSRWWWRDHFAAGGWEDITQQARPALESRPQWADRFAAYDWDFFILERSP